KEGLPLPDLIIVDGGVGHMNSVKDVLINELSLDIPIAGLRKDDKHATAELLYGDDAEVVPMKKNSQSFYLLQRIEDEVQRFAIRNNRNKRSKTSNTSQQGKIEGVGASRKRKLIKEFCKINKMKEINGENFKEIGIPENVAKNIVKKLSE